MLSPSPAFAWGSSPHDTNDNPFDLSKYSRLSGNMMQYALNHPTGGNPVGSCDLAVQALTKCRSGMGCACIICMYCVPWLMETSGLRPV